MTNHTPSSRGDYMPSWGEHNLHQRIKARSATPSATTKSLELMVRQIDIRSEKSIQRTLAAIDNLIRKERSQAIASYKKVLAEETRLKGGIDADQ